jgi:hypothetical protein
LYPQFADCIHAPRRRKGQKYPKVKPFNAAKAAADFARRIRALWQQQYGTKNRKQGEKSAEDFAIEIANEWFEEKAAHLTVDAVLAAAKTSGKHKTRKTRK